MTKCTKCGVSLSGFLSRVPRLLFAVMPSEKDASLCNKCAEKHGRYQCRICGRMIHEERSLEHVRAEEYLLGLIKKDHSHWGSRQPSEEECIQYYRELIRKTEI